MYVCVCEYILSITDDLPTIALKKKMKRLLRRQNSNMFVHNDDEVDEDEEIPNNNINGRNAIQIAYSNRRTIALGSSACVNSIVACVHVCVSMQCII